jgi:gliding motility-associated-like protein
LLLSLIFDILLYLCCHNLKLNMFLRRCVLFLIFFINTVFVFATHQRAGEISYRYLSGLTYEFTVTTYTYTPSLADRPQIDLYWGDGSSSTVDRTSKTNLGNDISINIYITQHTFPAAGSYSITFEDPNRNAGIVNIPNSVNIPFFIETILIINPFLGSNSSPQLLNPPIDDGCLNVTYYHNPGAYDPDGDSLSYSLITCRGYDGEDIPGYSLPAASSSISIDPYTGDLVWDAPMMVGEYNIAILIKEYRYGVLIGSMVRDMQIDIVACNNTPPVITTIADTCILEGTNLVFNVTASDNTSSQVSLSAVGAPFEISNSPATFPAVSGAPPVTSQFEWLTNCSHVRLNPYNVLFKATDNGPQVNLSSYKTVNITVIAPKPENLTAIAIGNNIYLSWSPHICSNAVGYKIYKRRSSNPFIPDYCETGMPADEGYHLIGTTGSYLDTIFVDDGSVMPSWHANEYCYRIVAFFSDNAESYVSDEVCTYLMDDAPLITNVDVEETNPEFGIVSIKWMRPMELDTVQFLGPDYEYHIFRASSQDNNFQLIGKTYSISDTVLIDTNLNTSDFTYYYRVEIWGYRADSLVMIETSDRASSVFLNILPTDRALKLSWNEQVPWTNLQYVIYRYNNITAQYDSLSITQNQYYIDDNLTNGVEYCYYVRSIGGYFIPDTIYPLYNRSQKHCEFPIDNVPPEIPSVTISTDCETVTLTWIFTTDTSYFDIYQYYLYYKPTYGSSFTVIDSFRIENNSCYPEPCSFIINDIQFITGCFGLAVVDSNGNLSSMSIITCFDYDECMTYSLPNVFTPNGDGVNDFFIPFPYTNIQKVDFQVHNRWGKIVFKTEDPDINWDGTDYISKQPLPDGTYYYVCDVYVQTLSGIITIPLHGTITLLTGG